MFKIRNKLNKFTTSDIIILAIMAAIFCLLRTPLRNTILSDSDQLYTFNQGARLLKSSLTMTGEWYTNFFAQLFILSNHGLSDTLLPALNLLILKMLNIKIVWWSYFLFYQVLDFLNLLLLYFLLKSFVRKYLAITGAMLYLTMPIFMYYSTILPCWLIYCVFFELLTIIFMYLFYIKKRRIYLYLTSLTVTLILLGDVNFPAMLLLVIIYIHALKKENLINKNDLLRFFIAPAAIILLNIAFAVLSIYKGYYLGILGYVLGHHHQVSIFTLGKYVHYIKQILFMHGFIILLNLYLIIKTAISKIFVKKRLQFDLFGKLFFIWNGLLLLAILLFRRGDLVLGLYLLPAIIFTVYVLDKSSKIYLYIVAFLILTQFSISLNTKYSFFELPSIDSFRIINKDIGQKAVGFWIREKTQKEDQVLIVTPYNPSFPYIYSDSDYLLSSELYFGKIYTYCKGNAPKKLFSVKNCFNGKVLYNLDDPPMYIVDFSGRENNFFKLKSLIGFPVESYTVRAMILDKNDEVVANIYQKGWNLESKKLKKADLDNRYDNGCTNFDDFVFSPYQGLWTYIP